MPDTAPAKFAIMSLFDHPDPVSVFQNFGLIFSSDIFNFQQKDQRYEKEQVQEDLFLSF